MRDVMSNTQFGQFVSILNPRAKPQRVNAFVEAARNHWPVPEPEWPVERQRHVNVPKRPKDEMQLRDFMCCCREGHTEEVRVYATRMPHLLAFTDRYGFTVLHHAVMSEKVELISLVLKAYRHPRAFLRRSVSYVSLEALQADGLHLQRGRFRSGPRMEEEAFIVQEVPPRSLAGIEEVQVGDMLEAVDGNRIVKNSLNQDVLIRLPTAKEVAEACAGSELSSQSFPLTLTFCRPAHASILARFNWDFLDRAASLSAKIQKIRNLIWRETTALCPDKDEEMPISLSSDVASPSAVSSAFGSPSGVSSHRRASARSVRSKTDEPVRLPALVRARSEPHCRR